MFLYHTYLPTWNSSRTQPTSKQLATTSALEVLPTYLAELKYLPKHHRLQSYFLIPSSFGVAGLLFLNPLYPGCYLPYSSPSSTLSAYRNLTSTVPLFPFVIYGQ
jgi:phosphoglycerol transferase MdoB-like AlkP superfamily enzyme